uniref:Uncharacterized protein n=1 Tax=Arundo donax TaxID=35708 RepID=A0A0A9BE61_ARUDO
MFLQFALKYKMLIYFAVCYDKLGLFCHAIVSFFNSVADC